MESARIPILLVEDEPDLRDALQEYLDACGFAVTAVGTARDALASALQTLPQILITDLTLPDRRGDSFLEEFHHAFPACLLYIHSGDSSFVPGKSLQACGLTASHVFAKPADLAEMVIRLKSELEPRLNEKNQNSCQIPD